MRDIVDPLIFPARGNRTAETFGFIVAERFRQQAGLALARFADAGMLPSAEAERLQTALTAARLRPRTIWHFSNGPIGDEQEMARCPERCLDQLMLSLGMAGLSVAHCVRSRGERLYTGDGRLIESGSLIRLRAEAGVLDLVFADQKRAGPRRECLVTLPALETDAERIDFMTREVADPFFVASIEHPLVQRSANRPQAFAECLDGIGRAAPSYRPWCVTAISSIIPLNTGSEQMVSGSQGACPGQVYMSAGLDRVKTAEMLIHEASHQYFRALQSVVRLTQRGDEEEFFSPVAGRHRPLQKLLLGFHAFANVLLYMKAALAGFGGSDRDFAERNMVSLERDLEGLAEGIDASTTLTNHGAYLWKRMKTATLAA